MNQINRYVVNGKPIVSTAFMVPSSDEGIELHVRHKHPEGLSTYSPQNTIVLVHGATYSSGSLYDVPVGGTSFLDWLAAAGFDVFALDVRGYGRSTRPSAMNAPAHVNAPLGRTSVGVEDLAAVVDFVRSYRNIGKVSLFGMSWGGSVVGAYTSRHNEYVYRLALLAPQWLSSSPIRIDTGAPLQAYRLVPVREGRQRWVEAAPEYARENLIPAGWFEQWADFTLGEDPWSTTHAPDQLRAVNGPIQDIRDYWTAGKPLYDPADIRAPTLLIHGEWDVDVPIELALDYFRHLSNAPHRQWIEIGEGTHMLLLERNRHLAFEAIRHFYRQSLAGD